MAGAVVLTRPISNYMDQLSFLETIRDRVRIQMQGISPDTRSCQPTPDELIEKNARLFTGRAGLDVLHEYFNLLQLPGDMLWSPELGLDQDECLPIVIMAMSDCWRRLVSPFCGMPWSIFGLVGIDDNDAEHGMSFLRRIGLEAGPCEQCQDKFFGRVSQLNV